MTLWDSIKTTFKKKASDVKIKKTLNDRESTKASEPKMVIYSTDDLISKLTNPANSVTNPVNYTVRPESPRCNPIWREERKKTYHAPAPQLNTQFMNENEVEVTNLGEERLNYSKFRGKIGYIPKKR